MRAVSSYGISIDLDPHALALMSIPLPAVETAPAQAVSGIASFSAMADVLAIGRNAVSQLGGLGTLGIAKAGGASRNNALQHCK